MFLKRLEIVGFKSFAERIAVDFVPGVTAVVGPNGSGKSNITDAIRWVLGEQSAKSLRGTKMEDVIFAGSDSRKPLNFAEVTLVLDNNSHALQTDYEEVSVTRRVYRSGDSEYLLNRQTCRLKDITELFMDSGLGKEAFSIISQGKVDEILNSKAEDRRAIFEETAGVLKYKQRKKKAEFKLLETDDNLNRVLDILHELESRIEPLQIQASVAKDYLEFAAELKTREIGLTLHDIHEAEQSKDKLVTAIEEASSVSESTRLEREQYSEKLHASRKQLAILEQQVDDLQDEAVAVSSKLERQEGRKLVLEEKQNNRAQQVGKLQASLEVAKQEALQLSDKLQRMNEQKQKQTNQMKELKAKRSKLEQFVHTSAADLDNQLDSLKSDYIELLNEEAGLKNEQRLLHQQSEKQQLHLKRFTDEVSEIEQQLKLARATHQEATAKKHTVDTDVEKTLQHYKQQQTIFNSHTEAFEKKRQLLFEGYQQLHQLRAKRDSLAELEVEFSGYFYGVKELLKQRDQQQLEGIRGAVAEILIIPPSYVTAIDTAIGGQAQHVVMENTRTAQRAISFLKQNRLGRATFLPMDVIKERHVQSFQLQKIAEHPAFIATANTLVSCEPEYAAIRDNLLGTILVAKDLNGATELAKLINNSYRIVTLEGDVVHPGGSLTGGATKKQSSVFTRKADLENYSQLVAKLENDLARAEKSVSTAKEETAAHQLKLESLRETGENLRLEQQTIYAELASATTLVEKWQDKFDDFHLQQQEHGDDREQATKRLLEIEKLLAQLKEKSSFIQQEIHSLTELKTKSVEQKDAIQNQLGELLTELAVASERQQQVDRDVAALTESSAKASTQIQAWEDELSWYQTGHDNQTADELASEIQQLADQKVSLTEKIREQRELRAACNQQIRSTELQEEDAAARLRNVSISYEKLLVQKEQLEKNLTQYYEVLSDVYEMDYSFALANYTLPEDSERERSKIRLLKKSIEELGPINLSAIDEFEQVNERYLFLTEQRTDLLQAKETLHEAIAEMDEEMTERFSTTFYEIQKCF